MKVKPEYQQLRLFVCAAFIFEDKDVQMFVHDTRFCGKIVKRK